MWNFKIWHKGASAVVCAVLVLCLATCLGQVGVRQRQGQQPDVEAVPNAQLENWALSFGTTLWETARAATRFDAIQKRFHTEGAKVVSVDGFDMVTKMAANVETMMQHKIDAIKRIMEFAENKAVDHQTKHYDQELGHSLKVPPSKGGFHYFNAKKINVMDPDDDEELAEWDKYLSATDRTEDDDRFSIGYSRIKLEQNKYFSGIPVNTNMSVVHVPTNVFDGDPKVANAIQWSRELDFIFEDNYARDPSLSWQYFGSSTGFMRQYPAMKWLTSEHDPDLYDARMRDWYIKSAASPKEIVVLLDTSGSMTGLRKEIAKHVVLNILDTLGEDDFITVYKFSKSPTPLVECFTTEDGMAELVQATNENIREFQEAVNKVDTEEIANFTSALTVAFELLTESRENIDIGANCNQAIMLVTDGVPYKHEDIFKSYNKANKPVRVFTYLIGREISDLKAANWMACHNRGYFTHVTTLAEVKEQVLKYIPVMARPMVMYKTTHPIQWTGVYADIEDPKTSRWLWDIRERARQRKRTENYREIMRMQQENADPLAKVDLEDDSAATRDHMEKITRLSDKQQMERFLSYGQWGLTDDDIVRLQKDDEMRQRLIREITDAKTQKWTIPPKHLALTMDSSEKQTDKFTGYRLMTSVSIPVFDQYNHTDPERLGLKKNPEAAFLRKVRIAELLGVAGTDVPIREIEKLTPPHQLGVNGYAFAVNNNGYILFHPDLRPMFQEILKPNYNSVDLAEVELVDTVVVPRGNDSELLAMRRDMVDQRKGQNFLRVKQHYDDMKRATVRTQDYFYHPMVNTPFSLGIAFPRDYGRFRIDGKVEVTLAKFNVSEKFDGTNWRLHPDWVYCEYNYAGSPNREFDNPEDTMRHFLRRAQQRDWTWGTPKVLPLPKCYNNKPFDANCRKCDVDLVKSLIFDAVVTHDFENQKSPRHGRGPGGMTNETYKRFGIQLAFVATRSGLLRYSDHSHLFKDPNVARKKNPDDIPEPHFADINNKATDEVWYKRAVDYHRINPKAFVYSIPFDVGGKKTKVTATHAVMVGKGNEHAPAAVAGMQIDYDIFREMFFNRTTKCVEVRGGAGCKKTCASEDLDCYVIDNNGFVIISEAPVHTGKFFGEVDGTILESLIQHQIYKKIQIYDYQAICLETEDDGSSAISLLAPFKLLGWAFNYILGQIAWTIIRLEIHHLWNPDWTYAFPQQSAPVVSDTAGAPPDYIANQDYDEYYADVSDMGEGDYDDPLLDEFSIKDGGPIPLLQMTYINKTTPKPCDKEVTLYELNEEKLYRNGKPVPVKGRLSTCHDSDCQRPFSVQLIPHTNLILIVADKLCPCFSTKISIEPTKVEYGPANETAYCDRLKYNIYRRKPQHCIGYHPEESEIKLCGDCTRSAVSHILLLAVIFVHLLFPRRNLLLHS